MRTLFEIIDSAKSGEMPTHEECYWAMLAFSALHFFDHHDLEKLARHEKETGKANNLLGAMFYSEESLRRFQVALNKSPKDYMGKADDPSNPDVQARRKIGLKILETFLRKGENEKGGE
jgi:hypothetical protein